MSFIVFKVLDVFFREIVVFFFGIRIRGYRFMVNYEGCRIYSK